MQLIAIHEIQRRGSDHKLEVIAPGKSFSATEKEAESLFALGAARKGKGSPEPEAPAGGEGSGEGDGDTDLSKLTKPELVEYAKENGIEIDAGATKAAILEVIAAEKAADDDLV